MRKAGERPDEDTSAGRSEAWRAQDAETMLKGI
ncbi:hypothetical protein Fuma_03070 [Fuerstiella marisgermanici]|uniref:Uncharacterized protein n=1 Tax=Fuerstiella marisgermanici TaxID=1891926 RepID=A0A1P8WHC4_9PLAN|nr:hypothetical protein Fuma_03070 [Fuerstiella marisgermanici]